MSKVRDWSEIVNVSGTVGSQKLAAIKNDIEAPEGFYIGTIEDCYIDVSKNPDKISFRIEVAGGDYKGATCWGSIWKQGTTKFDNSRYWRDLYESIGIQAAHLDAGNLEAKGSFFVGKTTCFYWKPGDPDNAVWSDLRFLSPRVWKEQSQVFQAQAGSALSGVAASAPVAVATPATATPVVPVPQPTQVVSIPVAAPTSVAVSAPSNGVSSTPAAGFAPPDMSGDDLLKMLNNS